ncbi:MAG: spore protease YyaC [Eubacteriales bacterium]|jgi:putative sporulation protein YyaC|nr:spore protease YyaC [Bacillota bacterium]MBV1727570.1 spore protease YyaC [Desulforudis sp.]MDP3050593.1 spore protease YyaC [Eubacteriales bacterium]MDQ7789679.1 spore protease YyaC [Clostridia bacterium]MBU4534126.1 spore protease YyaC [Bacillota bacterium]
MSEQALECRIGTPALSRIHIDDSLAAMKLAEELYRRLSEANLEAGQRPIVLLCIGTDRSTGDSLGPLVGSLLSATGQNLFSVYGTLEEPVHATNLEQVMAVIRETYQNPYIIAVDACLGNQENIGYVNIVDGPLKPGAGVKKTLPSVGELHITGVVNVGGFMEYMILQSTRLNIVMQIAHVITDGIKQTIYNHKQAAAAVDRA